MIRLQGKKINWEKTNIFSKNTSDATMKEIHDLMGTQATTRHDKYIGLLMLAGRSKASTFNSIKKRLMKRLQGWKENTLSRVGREILIKSMVQAIPTYTMSCFKILKTWFDELNSMTAKYRWSGQKGKYIGNVGSNSVI